VRADDGRAVSPSHEVFPTVLDMPCRKTTADYWLAAFVWGLGQILLAKELRIDGTIGKIEGLYHAAVHADDQVSVMYFHRSIVVSGRGGTFCQGYTEE
jgi:hypothetical protein